MKKLLLLLGLLLCPSLAFAQGQVAGPPNAILCNQMTSFGPTTGASVFSVTSPSTLQGSQRVYLCGWHITTQNATAGTFQIIQGVVSGGIQCGAQASTITPSLAVSNTAPSTDHIDFAFTQTPSTGAQVCVNSAGTSVSGLIYFTQF